MRLKLSLDTEIMLTACLIPTSGGAGLNGLNTVMDMGVMFRGGAQWPGYSIV